MSNGRYCYAGIEPSFSKALVDVKDHWRHEHRIEKHDAKSADIVDKISFQTKYWLLDYLLFPLFWGMIVYRIPLYKLYLNQPTNL